MVCIWSMILCFKFHVVDNFVFLGGSLRTTLRGCIASGSTVDLLWLRKYTRCVQIYMTSCEILWWKQSQRWAEVKVVKWCWNKWNGHILVHIYHKQCEFIQKIRWKGSNGQLQWFNKATSGALCWKRQKNTKTRGTKTQITQNFEKVWPI